MIALITAIFGGYDALTPVPPELQETTTLKTFCFTDHPEYIHAEGWTPIKGTHPVDLPRSDLLNSVDASSPRIRHMMRAKYYKTQFHHVPELDPFDIIIWVDAAFDLKPFDVNYLSTFMQDKPWVVFRHRERKSIQEEVEFIAGIPGLRHKYRQQPLYKQLLSYQTQGYDVQRPDLCEMGCFLVQARDAMVQKVLDTWWQENQTQTFQDQLSFPYVTWKHEFQPHIWVTQEWSPDLVETPTNDTNNQPLHVWDNPLATHRKFHRPPSTTQSNQLAFGTHAWFQYWLPVLVGVAIVLTTAIAVRLILGRATASQIHGPHPSSRHATPQ